MEQQQQQPQPQQQQPAAFPHQWSPDERAARLAAASRAAMEGGDADRMRANATTCATASTARAAQGAAGVFYGGDHVQAAALHQLLQPHVQVAGLGPGQPLTPAEDVDVVTSLLLSLLAVGAEWSDASEGEWVLAPLPLAVVIMTGLLPDAPIGPRELALQRARLEMRAWRRTPPSRWPRCRTRAAVRATTATAAAAWWTSWTRWAAASSRSSRACRPTPLVGRLSTPASRCVARLGVKGRSREGSVALALRLSCQLSGTISGKFGCD